MVVPEQRHRLHNMLGGVDADSHWTARGFRLVDLGRLWLLIQVELFEQTR